MDSTVELCFRCLPMNLTSDDVAAGVLRDRSHAGSSMADIEPMEIDRTVGLLLVTMMIFSALC